MASVQYDSTELVNATYIPRYVKHENSPERQINSLKLARQDGEVIVDDSFSIKFVDIEGFLVGSSQSDLESKIDNFKELISRKDKNLDIAFAGGTRRYVCRSVYHEINRDFYHLLHAPYKIRFIVPTGYGKDTSETTAVNVSGITATTSTQTPTFAGSYKPKPRHKITLTTRGNADVIRIENTVTGDYIDVDLDGCSNGDYVEVDEENLTVKKNGTTNLNYRGKFPSVEIGSASLKITVYGSSYTEIITQTSNHGGLTGVINSDGGSVLPWGAQSFIPTQSGRIKKISAYLGKDGSPTGDADFLIYDDNNGKPGSKVNSHGSLQISLASIGAVAWKDLTISAGNLPFIVKGRRYWLINNSNTITVSDASNFLRWGVSDLPTDYTDGKAMAMKNNADVWYDGFQDASLADGVANGQYDYMFKINLGDGAAASHSIVWQVYYTKKYL